MPLSRLTLPLAAVAALAAFPAAAQAPWTFNPVDFPGAGSTLPLGINGLGQIVGEITNDPALPPLVLNGQDFWTTGFELDAGVYSLIYYPAAQTTGANPGWPAGSATGISNIGTVVGGYATNATNALGYTESGGVYTAQSFAPAPGNFTPTGINSAGVIAGTCTGCSPGEGSSAYIDDHGAITIIDGPDNGGGTVAGGDINEAGQMIVQTAAGTSYLYTNGSYAGITVFGAQETLASSVNDDGVVAGSYEDQSGLWHGFVDDNGTYVTVDNPLGAGGTRLTGINDANQIVGSYDDGTGVVTGFEASPVREPTSIALFGTCLVGLGLTWRRKRRSSARRQPDRRATPAFESCARFPVSR